MQITKQVLQFTNQCSFSVSVYRPKFWKRCPEKKPRAGKSGPTLEESRRPQAWLSRGRAATLTAPPFRRRSRSPVVAGHYRRPPYCPLCTGRPKPRRPRRFTLQKHLAKVATCFASPVPGSVLPSARKWLTLDNSRPPMTPRPGPLARSPRPRSRPLVREK